MSSAAHDFGGLIRQQVIYHVDTLPFLPQTVQAKKKKKNFRMTAASA